MDAPWLMTMLVLAATQPSCTKRNSDICCDTIDQCTQAGIDASDGFAHCDEGVCVNYTCVASGCDDDGDCHDPNHPMCVSGQCYGPAEACRDRGGFQILFLSNRSGVSQIYRSFADGSGVTRITQDEMSLLYRITPSPDGARLAYIQHGDVFTVSTNGEQPKQLTADTLNADVHWSPDATMLAVSPEPVVGATAFTMRSDGTQRHEFVVPGYITRNPAWSPDSTQVAFVTESDSLMENNLWVANADGSAARELAGGFTPQLAEGADPAWKPDGSVIAAVFPEDFVDPNHRSTIFLKPTDGSPGSFFGPRGFPMWDVGWAHDGAKLLSVRSNSSSAQAESDPAGTQIAVMNSDGSNLYVIGSGFHAMHPRWSPDDKYIIFQDKTSQGDLEIYRMNADGANVLNLTMSSSDDFEPEWAACPVL